MHYRALRTLYFTGLVTSALFVGAACSSDEDSGGNDNGGTGGATGGGGSGGSGNTNTGGSGNTSTGGTGGSTGGMAGMGGHGGMDMGCVGGETYMPGMTKSGDNFDVELVMSMPEPGPTGDYDWTIRITEKGTDTVVTDATLDANPWMAAMDHGSPIDDTVTNNGDGTYLVETLNLFMGGVWDVTLTVVSGSNSDEIMFSFCVGEGMDMDGGMNMDMDGGMNMDMDGGMNMDMDGSMSMDSSMNMDGSMNMGMDGGDGG